MADVEHWAVCLLCFSSKLSLWEALLLLLHPSKFVGGLNSPICTFYAIPESKDGVQLSFRSFLINYWLGTGPFTNSFGGLPEALLLLLLPSKFVGGMHSPICTFYGISESKDGVQPSFRSFLIHYWLGTVLSTNGLKPWTS